MMNNQDDKDNEIIIDVDDQNEFDQPAPTNEFEEEDENDFLAEDQESKEESSYVIDNTDSTTTNVTEQSNGTDAVSNDAMLNPENEKILFEKLGSCIVFGCGGLEWG